jgi:hypothetical protein
MLGHYAWDENLRRVDALLDRPAKATPTLTAKIVSLAEHRP